MRRRRKDISSDDEPFADDAQTAPAEVPSTRADGPWDAAERDTDGLDDYVDLGSLRVRSVEGLDIQVPVDDDDTVGSVVFLLGSTAALEVRAFAARRSGGLWDEVRADILDQLPATGESAEVVGLYGTELHVQVPATTPDGEPGLQASRIIGVDGPRWFLRATFLGQAALEPSDEGPLMEALKGVVVVRGDGPMAPRTPLLLTLPDDAVRMET